MPSHINQRSHRQDNAQRAAAIQYAVMVLGHCFVQPTEHGTYVLHNLAGGIYVVTLEQGGLVCLTCKWSMADEHTAIVTLYRKCWEGL